MSTQLSYDDLKQELIQELQKYTHGFLATSDGNFVTARQMMLITDGLTISCFTSKFTRKYKQIIANKNVALAINNIQIEGVATLKGHTSDTKNKGFLKAYEKSRPNSYEFWRDQLLDPNSRYHVIEISPKRISVWVRKQPKPYNDVLHIDKKTAIRYFVGEEYE